MTSRPVTEVLEMEGHLIDSLQLAKALDAILSAGADYTTLDFQMGRTNADVSRARIEVRAPDELTMESLLVALQEQGANRVDPGEATVVATDQDGVLPAGFYSTTNLPTRVRLDGVWHEVENPEMDCALVVRPDGRVRTEPMHRVRSGDRIVVGHDGVQVTLPHGKVPGSSGFEFMASEVSSEKPKGLLVADVAERMRTIRSGGHPNGCDKILAVCGPAVIHTGAGPALAKLVRHGWINLLFAGNGFATHDIESNVMGTSLGISVREGHSAEGGHANHLRVINEVRRYGSIASAVEAGYVEGGVMYECVRKDVPFVLAGSLRDDGPLPDVQSDVVQAADAMRYLVPDVGMALMFSTTLHAIATGNILPAWVETFCVDINQAVVTKLTDRGSHQAMGIVTDVGLFVQALADELVDDA